MRFAAPSSEDVYANLLRQNGRERRLTDRFGWSLLVVNDGSWESMEFLSRYAVDLCAHGRPDPVRLLLGPVGGGDERRRVRHQPSVWTGTRWGGSQLAHQDPRPHGPATHARRPRRSGRRQPPRRLS